jgi:pyruvate formate-lyase/glycerol dehydratase family glycyl radical enzyme
MVQVMTNRRIEKLKEAVVPTNYPLCTEMATLMTESYKQSEDEPNVLRVAKAHANILDKITIFIEDGELIVGNAASKPMGVEIRLTNAGWPKEQLKAVREEGYGISEKEEAEIQSQNDYWKTKRRKYRTLQLYDDDRLWPFMQSGWMITRWKSREEASELGFASSGFEFYHVRDTHSSPYWRVLNKGLNSFIEDAEKELKNINFNNPGSLEKVYFLQAAIISHKAVIRFANRFAVLAAKMALKEVDPIRKKELERIAKTCQWVPANPARNFYEAIQSLWFIFLMVVGHVTPFGRFDQYMYPFYKKDIEEGRITDEEVLELLQCLRIKDMQINEVSGSTGTREKRAGHAKWHNMVIGGQTADGKDATNELTYLVLEAAKRCQTPHHTITVRVHEGTPEALMLKALDLVKTGIGIPAFVGDKSYIEYLLSKDVPMRLARDYHLIGCLDADVPEGRATLYGLVANTVAWNFLFHNGFDPNTGKQVGPKTGDLESFKIFDDMMKAFKTQYAHFMALEAETRNLEWQMVHDQYPSAFITSLFSDGMKVGKSLLDRPLPFKMGNTMSPVGMINMADSLAAVKKLVFEEKKVTMKELKAALEANWQGYEEIRKMCLAAPKYGNDNDYVDSIAKDLYQFYADTASTLDGPREGEKYCPAAISITTHWPAGKLTEATPDGRYAGEILADGSTSPAQGKDTRGPTAVIKSASKIDQMPFQSTLLNMKFHPSALKTTEDMRKLSVLIKTYFSMNGKHIQFNVVGKETLLEAQKYPEKHHDLVVRVAGYSAYFVQLTKPIQDEIIGRAEFEKTA